MLSRLEQILVDVATISIILLAILIFADVVALNVFDAAIPDTVVIVRELMVLAIVLPLAAATTKRAHISVEFVTNFLPDRIVNWCIVVGGLVGVLALVPLIWSGSQELLHQWNTGSAFYGELNLPKWPGRLAFVIGITLCWLRLVIMVICDTAAALQGKTIHDSHS